MRRQSRLRLGLTLLIFVFGVPLSAMGAAAPGSSGPGEKVTLEVLNPRGETPAKPLLGIRPRLADLSGKKIGLVDNTKTGVKLFFDRLEQELKARFPTSTIMRFRKKGYSDRQPELYREVATKCDTFILAMGD